MYLIKFLWLKYSFGFHRNHECQTSLSASKGPPFATVGLGLHAGLVEDVWRAQAPAKYSRQRGLRESEGWGSRGEGGCYCATRNLSCRKSIHVYACILTPFRRSSSVLRQRNKDERKPHFTFHSSMTMALRISHYTICTCNNFYAPINQYVVQMPNGMEEAC